MSYLTAADITPALLARIYRKAAKVLETGVHPDTCCGLEVDDLGACMVRPYHPTRAHPNPLGYPDAYTKRGKLIR